VCPTPEGHNPNLNSSAKEAYSISNWFGDTNETYALPYCRGVAIGEGGQQGAAAPLVKY